MGPINLLIDGHNRYEICTRLGIEYSVSELQFDCRDDAENWIDVNQAGKRNLGPISFRIVSGRIYNRRKKKHGGERRSKDQIDPLKTEASTAAEVASELGVGEATIKRNGQRAALHDDMVAIGDKEAADAVKTMPQADVSRLVKDDPKLKGEQSDEDKAEAERQRRLKIAAEAKAAKAVHVSQNTGMPEWYTPTEFIEACPDSVGLLHALLRKQSVFYAAAA
ncbi:MULTISPECIES: hypothetical protein [Rhodopirellula]|uniref:hypothetical protein n=1 Tax=Rhodopirellula TaxID=265488 RepID=UPI00257D0F71|nr:hypothetical protein [Rhodopirellula sp. UBA1907]